MLRLFFAFVAVVLSAGLVAAQTAIPPDLKNYVDQKDDSFSWKLKSKVESDAGTVYTIDLISQTWHDIKWDHGLVVVVPKGSKPASTMLLWNQGGTPNATNTLMCVEIARRVNSPCAFLFGIPKQPLYDGKKEDALIAETFIRYLDTKDSTWPLLFPMVKSMVKTMDCLQAFAKEELKTEVKSFVVTGASKRGWTSWLTAATGDKRVKAIAPMVIDTLNFQLQMPNQLKSFGKYSEQIKDYEDRKLLPLPETTEARKLWTMVDPIVYRDNLTMPKMIINGTNDPYWAQDALNMYWNLKGEKYVCYVPNAGHGLTPETTPNQPGSKRDPFPMRAISCLAAFTKHQVEDKPMPKQTWKYEDMDKHSTKLTVCPDKDVKAVRYWTATSKTRDFRQSKWTSKDITPKDVCLIEVATAGDEFKVVLADVDYEIGGLAYTLTTQVKILEPKK